MTPAIVGIKAFYTKQTGKNGWIGELIAFCPQCKDIQTVWINQNGMIPTRKFIQKEDQIYHDCGTGQACRLYPTLK